MKIAEPQALRMVRTDEGKAKRKDYEMHKIAHGFNEFRTAEPSIRIRKLTPRECFRLMGFSDEDFDKASAVNSNTQLYRQAGNSICVPVLEAIFKQML